MKTIGFAGYTQSGKDTAAKAICDQRYILEASRDVKAGLLRLDPFVCVSVRHRDYQRLQEFVALCGWDEAKQHPEVRRLLATFGVDAGRELHGDDCWVSKLRFTLDRWADEGVKLACVTGIRFANEVALCNRVIWVEHPGRGEGEHKSEKLEAIKAMADATLRNDGTEAEWVERVKVLFSEVTK